MTEEYKAFLDRIKAETAVYITLGPSTITYLGKKDNIKEAQ
jgi:hypothetical protein